MLPRCKLQSNVEATTCYQPRCSPNEACATSVSEHARWCLSASHKWFWNSKARFSTDESALRFTQQNRNLCWHPYWLILSLFWKEVTGMEVMKYGWRLPHRYCMCMKAPTHTFNRKRPHWKYWHHRYRKITELVHLHNISFRVLKNWQIFYWYYSALKVAELNENLKSSKMDTIWGKSVNMNALFTSWVL